MREMNIDGYELLSIKSDGNEEHVAYVSNLKDAINWVEKGGWRKYREVKKTIRIFETEEELEVHMQERLRQRALAKLSFEERQALGLE
jgi:hypothetical protein